MQEEIKKEIFSLFLILYTKMRNILKENTEFGIECEHLSSYDFKELNEQFLLSCLYNSTNKIDSPCNYIYFDEFYLNCLSKLNLLQEKSDYQDIILLDNILDIACQKYIEEYGNKDFAKLKINEETTNEEWRRFIDLCKIYSKFIVKAEFLAEWEKNMIEHYDNYQNIKALLIECICLLDIIGSFKLTNLLIISFCYDNPNVSIKYIKNALLKYYNDSGECKKLRGTICKKK